jgi:hypothetical protein
MAVHLSVDKSIRGRDRSDRREADIFQCDTIKLESRATQEHAIEGTGTMRAALAEEFGGIDSVRLGELPEPAAGPGQVLVRVPGRGPARAARSCCRPGRKGNQVTLGRKGPLGEAMSGPQRLPGRTGTWPD